MRMTQLESRLAALEQKAAPPEGLRLLVHLIGVNPDGSPPAEMSRAQVAGRELLRDEGEAEEAFLDRVRAAHVGPGIILVS